MPFTPFHLGPGAVFKAAAGRRFSFMVFGGCEVLMDIEPLIHMVRGDTLLHGPTHTISGALVIGAAAGSIGKPISEAVLRMLAIPYYPFTWPSSFVAAFAGTFSHIALDAVMHTDIEPLAPFS